MTSEELENIIDNDQGAYKEFYKEYFKKLFNYGRKFTEHFGNIEDTIQEVFLDIWVNKHKLKNVNSLNGYLFSSFRYILLKRIKDELKIVNSEQFEAEPEFSIDYLLINEELNLEVRGKLKKAIESLTSRQREAVFLRFYQNLSFDEIAAILNISVKGTYKIMARSLAALKENMQIHHSLLIVILGLKHTL